MKHFNRFWVTVLALAVFTPLAVPASNTQAATPPRGPALFAAASSGASGSLETAASRASTLGRTIAFSLIGLALAMSAVVLVFRRDFKEAIGLLVIGVIAVLLASPAGLSVLQETVSTLFGAG
jgi:FtsH-binding integral membrane protein